jgi:thiamine biosynthesis lipoprotein
VTRDVAFSCMGCEMRLIAEGVGDGELRAARELLDEIDARLSRFRPDSELSRLNADPRTTVPASPLLRAAVGAALWAAEWTGGLVDPTLLGDLERAGYADGLPARIAPEHALATAPPRMAARPRVDARWGAVAIDNAAATITRPPGLRLDTAGTTKGLAADAAALVLAGDMPGLGGGAAASVSGGDVPGLGGAARRLAVDCGGDLHVAGAAGLAQFEVVVEHPLTGEPAAMLRMRGGGVATSGIGRRVWVGADGRPAHHLLDPATGAPAWTGLIAATAIASTAVGAEALAKAALLSGPPAARRLLRRHGGVLVHDDGTVERVGPRRTVARDERPRAAAA